MNLFDIFRRKPKPAKQALEGNSFFEVLKPMFLLSESGVDADELPNGHGEFGLSQSNPIPCKTILGSRVYLEQLRTLDGTKVVYQRVGSIASDVSPHPVDEYEISHPNGRRLATLFISPYENRISRKAPRGFTLAGLSSVTRAGVLTPHSVDRPAGFRAPVQTVAHVLKETHQVNAVRAIQGKMHEVVQHEPSAAFRNAWIAAGQHLQKMGGEGIHWLRAELNPPMAEHLSFRLGNQLVFVFVQPENGVSPPSSLALFKSVASEATAIPCLMRMEQFGGRYQPRYGGWGLTHAQTDQPVDVGALVSNEPVEMSDWELHDFAIQVVCREIEKSDGRISSRQPSPHIDPAIWFREAQGLCWVIVRAGRYPATEAECPPNVESIKRFCTRMSSRGYFASVTAASSEQPTAPANRGALPLLRGHGLIARFRGLRPV